MKKFASLAIIAMIALPLSAQAQNREQQVYPPYPNVMMVEPSAGMPTEVYSPYATQGYVPQGVRFAHKMDPWPYDPAKARKLLAEAGYPNGFETVLWGAYTNTTTQKVLQFLQQQLAQVGIKVSVLVAFIVAALVRRYYSSARFFHLHTLTYKYN